MAANLDLTTPKISWTDVVAKKQTIRDEHIKKHLITSVDSTVVAQITDIQDVDSLTLLIEKGKISAEKIIGAYIAK
jgi:hypothetical protein